MRFSTTALAAISALALMSLAAPALAAEVKYSADLTASAETPPTDSTGTGKLDATYDTDTKLLSWTVTYDGLTGDVTAAHFHGPAAVGAKAAPVVPIPEPYASPIAGSATLTDPQAADLQNGLWYFNLHTAKFPDGEVRGQVMAGGAATATTGESTDMSASSAMPMDMSSSSAAQ